MLNLLALIYSYFCFCITYCSANLNNSLGHLTFTFLGFTFRTKLRVVGNENKLKDGIEPQKNEEATTLIKIQYMEVTTVSKLPRAVVLKHFSPEPLFENDNLSKTPPVIIP